MDAANRNAEQTSSRSSREAPDGYRHAEKNSIEREKINALVFEKLASGKRFAHPMRG